MQSLDAARIVALWEQQAHHHGFERTLGLLEAACPELSDDERLSLTVGECHRALLRMRAQTFGDTLSASIDCPGCGVELELALSVEQLCAAQPESPTQPVAVTHQGVTLRATAPRCVDVLECLGASDEREARRRLLERCLVEDDHEGVVDCDAISSDALERLERALEEAEPLADVRTRVGCQACGHEFVAPLGVGGFVWREFAAEARRLVQQVHVLARAYGWRPHDVLSLSVRLRNEFMELATA